MKKSWALIAIAAFLLLGIAAPMLYAKQAQWSTHTWLSCVLLDEAEESGYLDKAKRAMLINDLVSSPLLSSDEREAAAALRKTCFLGP